MTAKQLKEVLTAEQIADFLEKCYKLIPQSNRTGETRYETVCHGGDGHNLAFYHDTKTFYCYSNCGSIDLFNIVAALESCEFPVAFKIVKNYFGIEDEEAYRPQEYNEEDLEQDETYNFPLIPFSPPIPERILASDQWYEKRYYAGWIKEGISIEAMQAHDIRWSDSYNHIVIPHRDIRGYLVGIRRRSLEDWEPKYMPLRGYEHHLGTNLYGIHRLRTGEIGETKLKRVKEVVLAESEKSVLLAHNYFKGAVAPPVVLATCGFNVSPIQMEIVKGPLCSEKAILAFDKDANIFSSSVEELNEAIPYYKKLVKTARRLLIKGVEEVEIMYDTVGVLQPKDSPFDRGETVYKVLYDRCRFNVNAFERIVLNHYLDFYKYEDAVKLIKG